MWVSWYYCTFTIAFVSTLLLLQTPSTTDGLDPAWCTCKIRPWEGTKRNSLTIILGARIKTFLVDYEIFLVFRETFFIILQNVFSILRIVFSFLQNIFSILWNIFSISQNIFSVLRNIFWILRYSYSVFQSIWSMLKNILSISQNVFSISPDIFSVLLHCYVSRNIYNILRTIFCTYWLPYINVLFCFFILLIHFVSFNYVSITLLESHENDKSHFYTQNPQITDTKDSSKCNLLRDRI